MKSTRNRKFRKEWIAAVLGLVLGLLFAGACSAYPAIDKAAPVALTVSAMSEGKAVSGLRLTLYKAADMEVTESGTIRFAVNDAFRQYDNKVDVGVDPNAYDSSDWADAAKNLEAHVRSDTAKDKDGKVFLRYSQVTGSDGKAAFTGIEQGLYLMLFGAYEGEEYASVSLTPVFLTLPQWSEKTSTWVYDTQSTAKLRVETKVDQPKTISVTAKKTWVGDSAPSKAKKRPTSVTVELVDSEGKTVSEAVLSAENGWAYTWTGLSEGTWNVKEKSVPKGYSVSYTEETSEAKKTVTVTNKTSGGVLGESREKETPEDETEKNKKKKNVRGSSRESDTTSGEAAVRLPQTGQLWWPVWLLSGIAAVLVIIGLILRLSGKKDLKD